MGSDPPLFCRLDPMVDGHEGADDEPRVRSGVATTERVSPRLPRLSGAVSNLWSFISGPPSSLRSLIEEIIEWVRNGTAVALLVSVRVDGNGCARYLICATVPIPAVLHTSAL